MKKAVASGGGPVALGAACGVRYQAVQRWVRDGCPAERVWCIEKATGVSRHELRPDLYPLEDSAA